MAQSQSSTQSDDPLAPIKVTATEMVGPIYVTSQSTASSSSWFWPSRSFNFSEAYSLLNRPQFYVNTAWEIGTKTVLTYAAKLGPARLAASLSSSFSILGMASIPLYEASTAADAETMFFQEASGNLPVNLPGPYGGGVNMGGGVYWVPDYNGQQ
jgi:hypothetical protein